MASSAASSRLLATLTTIIIFTVIMSGKYGRHLNVWNWKTHEKIDTIDLGSDGLIPLEVRFLHDPDEPQGYVGCALGSTVFRIFKDQVRINTNQSS